MRTLTDLLRIFVLGLLGFFGAILALVLLIAAIPVALVYAGFFWMGLVSAVAYAVNPTTHNAVNALGFLGVAAAMTAVAATLYNLPDVLRHRAARRRAQAAQQALGRIGGLRLASDASFNDRG